MYPVNQVIVGGDPMLNLDDIDMQIQKMEAYRQRLKQMKSPQPQQVVRLIWDDIDAEITPMTSEQKNMLFQNEEYAANYNRLQALVQAELLNLVKGRIENTQEGKELLSNQLNIVKKLKGGIIDSTNREMEMFKRFREFSKQNPSITYDEFLKLNLNSNGSK